MKRHIFKLLRGRRFSLNIPLEIQRFLSTSSLECLKTFHPKTARLHHERFTYMIYSDIKIMKKLSMLHHLFEVTQT